MVQNAQGEAGRRGTRLAAQGGKGAIEQTGLAVGTHNEGIARAADGVAFVGRHGCIEPECHLPTRIEQRQNVVGHAFRALHLGGAQGVIAQPESAAVLGQCGIDGQQTPK